MEGALSHGAWSRAERAMSCARPQPRTASSQPFWTPPRSPFRSAEWVCWQQGEPRSVLGMAQCEYPKRRL